MISYLYIKEYYKHPLFKVTYIIIADQNDLLCRFLQIGHYNTQLKIKTT